MCLLLANVDPMAIATKSQTFQTEMDGGYQWMSGHVSRPIYNWEARCTWISELIFTSELDQVQSITSL